MLKIRQFISVVVYVHNNADQIIEFINTVMPQCEGFKKCEIIFVDDFSTDNSLDVIKRYYFKHSMDYIVSIVKLGRYHGMETAMNAGRDMAIGDYVYEFDSVFVDFDGSVMIEAYNKCLEGNDMVFVSTDVPMRFTSKLFYSMFNRAMRSNEKLGQESFRLLSRRAINRITSMDVDIPYRKVIYHNSGLSTITLKYKSKTGKRPARINGKYERIDLAIDSFIFFTKTLQRISVLILLLFGLVSLATIIYTIASRALGYHIGMGWVSTMLFLSLGLTGLFALLTIVIRYLSVIVDLSFKCQKYLISDVEKIASK